MTIVYVAWLDPAMGKVLGAYATQTEAEAAIGRAQMDGSLSYDGAPTPDILEFDLPQIPSIMFKGEAAEWIRDNATANAPAKWGYDPAGGMEMSPKNRCGSCSQHELVGRLQYRLDELQGMFDMLERELRTALEKASEAAADRDRLKDQLNSRLTIGVEMVRAHDQIRARYDELTESLDDRHAFGRTLHELATMDYDEFLKVKAKPNFGDGSAAEWRELVAERDSLRKLRDNVQQLALDWGASGVSERPSWAMAADALERTLKGEQ